MNSFKAQIRNDVRSVFLNLSEFGELHLIEGKEITCVITDDTFKEGNTSMGMVEADIVVYAAPEDLPPRKSPGAFFNVGGREYIVCDWSVDGGLAQIALQQNRGI